MASFPSVIRWGYMNGSKAASGVLQVVCHLHICHVLRRRFNTAAWFWYDNHMLWSFSDVRTSNGRFLERCYSFELYFKKKNWAWIEYQTLNVIVCEMMIMHVAFCATFFKLNFYKSAFQILMFHVTDFCYLFCLIILPIIFWEYKEKIWMFQSNVDS